MTTNKIVAERVDHPETVVNYILKTDEQYFKECMKSVRCKLLTEVGYMESRSESDKGVAAVMHVVLNRANHPKMWPSTIAGVISQPWQFSYKNDGSLEKGFTDKKQYRRIAVIARKVMDGEVESPVGLATFYHTKQVAPSWRQRVVKVGSIGEHIFYK